MEKDLDRIKDGLDRMSTAVKWMKKTSAVLMADYEDGSRPPVVPKKKDGKGQSYGGSCFYCHPDGGICDC
jgi:hypothetical protein